MGNITEDRRTILKTGLDLLLAPGGSSLSMGIVSRERVCARYFVPANTLSWDTGELNSALFKIRAGRNSGFLLPRIMP